MTQRSCAPEAVGKKADVSPATFRRPRRPSHVYGTALFIAVVVLNSAIAGSTNYVTQRVGTWTVSARPGFEAAGDETRNVLHFIYRVNEKLYHSKSGDGGASWSSPELAADPGLTADVAVDSAGTLHMVYCHKHGTSAQHGDDIWYTAYANGTWSTPYRISTTTGWQTSPRVAVDGNDNVHVLWWGIALGPENHWANGCRTLYTRKPVGSSSFEPITQWQRKGGSGGAMHGILTVDPNGDVHAVYRSVLIVPDQEGGSWVEQNIERRIRNKTGGWSTTHDKFTNVKAADFGIGAAVGPDGVLHLSEYDIANPRGVCYRNNRASAGTLALIHRELEDWEPVTALHLDTDGDIWVSSVNDHAGIDPVQGLRASYLHYKEATTTWDARVNLSPVGYQNVDEKIRDDTVPRWVPYKGKLYLFYAEKAPGQSYKFYMRIFGQSGNAPSAPGSLSATAVSSGEVQLGWADNSDNEDGFKLERRNSGNDHWATIGVASNVTSHTDTPLAAATKFYYRIKSFNASGVSGYSAIANATTHGPVAFTAYNDLAWESGQLAVNITSYSRGQTGALLDHADARTLGARLAINTGGGTPQLGQGTNAAAYTDADSVFGGIVDAAGLIGYGPTNLTLTFSRLDPALRYEIVWYGNRAGGYSDRLSTVTIADVVSFGNAGTYGTDFSGPSDASTSLNTGENTANGHVVRYVEIEPGSDGDIELTVSGYEYSNVLMLKGVGTQNAPVTPSGLTATAVSGTRIDVSWTDNANNEDIYKVYRSPDGASGWVRMATLEANSASYTDQGLAGGTTWYYRVRAQNSGGQSAYTAVVSATTPDSEVSAFTAYNDLAWATGQGAANITVYTREESGLLVDHGTGAVLPVTLAVNGGGSGPYATQGADAADGTSAAEVFGGIVDCLGLISHETNALTLTIAGLDPAARYELALFGNRATPGYEGRTTTIILEGAESFVNTSSSGTTFGTTTDPDDTTTAANGNNTAAGRIVRYTQIQAGSDGVVTARLPAHSGTGDAGRYYLNALMLKTVSASSSVLAKGAAWQYRKATAEASTPATDWRRVGFDDSGWTTGNAPFGYGPLAYGTTLADMQGDYASLFLRKPFTIQRSALVTELEISVQFDDGFIMWLNGEEIARVNVSGAPGTFVAHDQTCSGYVGGSSAGWTRIFGDHDLPVLASNNVLAVQLFNIDLNSGDTMFEAELSVVSRQLSAAEDADGDGVPDDWEVAEYGSRGAWGHDDDPDQDGLSNIEEYIAGTGATNPASCFDVDLKIAGTSLIVSFPALQATGPGYDGLDRRYSLESRDSLDADDVWRPVVGHTNIFGQGQTVRYTNSSPSAERLYRGRAWLHVVGSGD